MNILPKAFILKLPQSPRYKLAAFGRRSQLTMAGGVVLNPRLQPLRGLGAIDGSHPPRSEVLPGLRCS